MPRKSKEGANAYARMWRAKNKDRLAIKAQSPEELRRVYEAHVRRKYGIELEDIARAFERQGGKCPGCHRSLVWGAGTHTDHCHQTMRFRGLLCQRCNQAVGLLDDSPEIFHRLISYLTK